MKAERFWKIAGVTASLLIMILGLLAMSLVVQPSELAYGAGPDPSQGPAPAVAPATGTPDPGSRLQIGPSGSDVGTCSNPVPIACGAQDSRDTGAHNADIDFYGCVGWDETGPEVIYSLSLAAGSNYTVTAELSGHTVDLDLFLLNAGGCLSPTAQCLTPSSFGSDSVTAGNLTPGTYNIAVDGYQGVHGTYTLSITCQSSNQPPNTPANPSPADKAIGANREPILSWTGGDPDIGDTVVYTIYGGLQTSVTGELWCAGVANTFCKPPNTLDRLSEHYWQVMARDQKGVSTWGPVWTFTTRGDTKVFLPIVLKKWRPNMPPQERSTATNTPTPTSSPTPKPTPPLPSKPGMRITNYTPYVIVSLTIDGAEQFPAKPLGLMPNYYMDVDLAAGAHQVDLYNGWWQDDGSRFTMYHWTGQETVLPGQMKTVDVTGPAITQLLPYFKASQYWQGEIWTGFPVTLRHAGFCFYDNGRFRFYLGEQEDDTGSYAELYRGVGSVTFRATNSAGTEFFDGVLNELDGSFKMANGPSDWRLVEYTQDSTVTCPPAPPPAP